MHSSNRIPPLQTPVTEATVSDWFTAMQRAGLLFHPEDDPAFVLKRDPVSGYDPNRWLFTASECLTLRDTIASIYAAGITDPCQIAMEALT